MVRTYDDSIAFRSEFPRQSGLFFYMQLNERPKLRFNGNLKVNTLFRLSYAISHEGLFTTLPFTV